MSFVLACGSTWCRGGRELVTAAFHVLLAVPAAVGGPRKRGPGADESKSESVEVSEEEEVYIGTFFFAGVLMAGGGDVATRCFCAAFRFLVPVVTAAVECCVVSDSCLWVVAGTWLR